MSTSAPRGWFFFVLIFSTHSPQPQVDRDLDRHIAGISYLTFVRDGRGGGGRQWRGRPSATALGLFR